MFSSNTKAVRHTCNCIVQSLEMQIHLFGWTSTAEITNILHYVVKYNHLNVTFNIRRLEPLKVCSNPVHLFMH